MDEVPLGPVRQAPGLSFIVRHHSEPEVLKDRFSPVCVRDGWLGDGRYLPPGLSGLTSWPSRGLQVGFFGWGHAAVIW
jgi:hypothetical protein